jgi:hypothetical protein
MKRKNLIIVSAFIVALTGAFSTKMFAARKVPQVWRQAGCSLAGEPIKCLSAGTTVCTVSGFTYYKDASCVTVITYNSGE